MYFYTSDTPGAPQLNNAYGDFNNVINYILDGGTPNSVVSIEAIEPNKCKLFFSDTIPFNQFQTFEVTGAVNSIYNTRYFVESKNEELKYIICYCETIGANTPIDNSPNIKARLFGCGMTKVFGGIENQRTVFKTENETYYRIDDRDFRPMVTPPVTINSANNSWMKAARVCIADGFDSLDSTSNRMYPYNPTRPTENFNPTGKYIGQTFVFYNRCVINNASGVNTVTYKLSGQTSNNAGPMKWKIYADHRTIYIILYTTYDSNATLNRQSMAVYVFGEFDGIRQDIKNSILYCNKSETYNETYDGNIFGGLYSRGYDNTSPLFPSQYTNGTFRPCSIIFSDTNYNTVETTFIGGSGLSPTNSGSDGLLYPNPLDGGFYISDVLVKSSSIYFGKCNGIKFINNHIGNNSIVASENIIDGSMIKIDNKFYILQKTSATYGADTTSANTLFTLYEISRY